TYASEAALAGRMTAVEASSFMGEVNSAARIGWATQALSSSGVITQGAGYLMMGGGVYMAGKGAMGAWEGYKKGDVTLFEFLVTGPAGLAQAGVPVIGHTILPTKFMTNAWTSKSF